MQQLQVKPLKFFFRFVIPVLFFVLSTASAHAASLYFSPSAPATTVGNLVTVKVVVNTESKSINNAEAVIQFPTDALEVVSVNRGQSIFSIWVEEPNFSNVNGTVSFNGGVPNPGYTGANGEVATIVFKAKKEGPASLVFGNSAVRQNDGLGTDILTAKVPSTVLISKSAETPVVVPAARVPAKPVVTSSTHPKSDNWYSETTASFNWKVPAGVTSIQTLLSRSPTAIPSITYDGSVSQRTVSGLEDNVLYFHIRYANSAGWGPVEHFKIQIDSAAPEKLAISVSEKNARDVLSIDAKDALSGIEKFKVRINGGAEFEIAASDVVSGEYVLPVLEEGSHEVSVTAFDRAGNQTESSVTYRSRAIPPPEIRVVPEKVERGESIVVYGTSSFPETNVNVYIEYEGGEIASYESKTDTAGAFTVTPGELTGTGDTYVWAEMIFEGGIRGPASDKAFVFIDDTIVVEISKSLLRTLMYVVPAVLLLLTLLILLYLGWHKFFGLRRRLKAEVEETVVDVHNALQLLKDELVSQIEKLEKMSTDRELTRREEKILDELKRNIDTIDNLVERKIKKLR